MERKQKGGAREVVRRVNRKLENGKIKKFYLCYTLYLQAGDEG
jgi:hypothetical protein